MTQGKRSSNEERKGVIQEYLAKNYGVKKIGEIDRGERDQLCRDLFELLGRTIPGEWKYKNTFSKIPFVFTKRRNWEGIEASQLWNKFILGQEIEFKSLDVSNKIKLIRNFLKNNFKYEMKDKLNLEISDKSTVKKTKISLFCAKHGWTNLNLSGILWEINDFICEDCAQESRESKNRLSFDDIKNEWNQLDRIVDDNQVYINNRTPINFFSKKYNWPAFQSWDSYNLNAKNGKNDPHDIRCLHDKKGYFEKLLCEYNDRNNTSYKIDPDWNIRDGIGPKHDIKLLAPEFDNFGVTMNWLDFFTYNQKPIFKSLKGNQTKYIKQFAKRTGRLIDDNWVYSGDAHELIEFKSDKPIYEGFKFKNSWQQINQGTGFSVQSMSNKHDFYSLLLKEMGYSLIKKIDNCKAFSQIINVKCNEGHLINRSLADLKRSPEGFCLLCTDHKPDNFKVFASNQKRRNENAYLYYCLLEDKDGNKAKKLGITKFKNRRLRFKSSYLYKDIFIHDDICELSRAEAAGIEKRILLDTRRWKYEGEFSAEDDSKRDFDGKTELRNLDMDDKLVISSIKNYLVEVKAKGWETFWLDNNPGKSERKQLKKMRSR